MHTNRGTLRKKKNRKKKFDMSTHWKRLVPKEISPAPAVVVDDDEVKELPEAQESDDEPEANAM